MAFTSPSAATLPLPNPAYLAFHAAIAKVVHSACMDRHLESILEERENIRVETAAEYLDGLLRVAQKGIGAHYTGERLPKRQ